MKVTFIFFIAAIFTFQNSFSQNVDKFSVRRGPQQDFIFKNYIANADKIDIESNEQMDEVFLEMEKSWKKYVDDTLAKLYTGKIPLETLYNIDPYSYEITLRSISNKTELSKDIEFHLLNEYMLPSLKFDVNEIKKDLDLQSYQLIWVGSINTIVIGSYYFQHKEIINDLFLIINELEQLLTTSMGKVVESTAKNNHRIVNYLNYYKYDIYAKYYFLHNETEKAFDSFSDGVSNQKYLTSNILPFATELINYFVENDKTDKSLSILNTIMKSTHNDEIPRDSLRLRYIAIDSINGEDLFNQVNQQVNGNLLNVSEVKIEVSPKYWSYIENELHLEKLDDAEYILIDFWYASCKPCIQEIPELNEFNKKLETRDNVIFISVNTDHFISGKDRAYVSRIIKSKDIRFPVVFDNDTSMISKQLKITGYPYKTILNGKGEVLEKTNKSSITLNTFKELLSN